MEKPTTITSDLSLFSFANLHLTSALIRKMVSNKLLTPNEGKEMFNETLCVVRAGVVPPGSAVPRSYQLLSDQFQKQKSHIDSIADKIAQ